MKIQLDFNQTIKNRKKIKIPGNLGKGSKHWNNNF